MKAKVTELSREELVDIITTGTYGSDFMQVAYLPSEWESLPESEKKGECLEEKCVDLLLNGFSIKLRDFNAEGEVYSDRGHIAKCADYGVYKVYLSDFLNACSSEDGMYYLEEIKSGRGDYYTGNNLLQIVAFGEVVYD